MAGGIASRLSECRLGYLLALLDAIQGQAAASVADTYGDVTLRTQADAIAKLPWIEVMSLPLRKECHQSDDRWQG